MVTVTYIVIVDGCYARTCFHHLPSPNPSLVWPLLLLLLPSSLSSATRGEFQPLEDRGFFEVWGGSASSGSSDGGLMGLRSSGVEEEVVFVVVVVVLGRGCSPRKERTWGTNCIEIMASAVGG